MAELPNARINELDEITVVNTGSFLVIYDSITGVTYKIRAELFTPTTDQNFDYSSTYEYDLDEVATFGGFWWQSLQNGNLNHTPTEGAWWTKLSKSPAFGLWAAGVYSEASVFVLQTVDGFRQLFRLASAVRPYVSSNFNTEWAAGDWELASERGYFIINKNAHGFAVNDQLTFKSGAWNKFTTGDRQLAIVRSVVNSNNVIAVIQGVLIKNLSGLTPGAAYYAQSNGTISTTATDSVAFIAISATEAIAVSGGGGSLAEAKAYTDAEIAQEVVDRNAAITAALEGVQWKDPVKAATVAALPAYTYTGGQLIADANGAFPDQDDVSFGLDDALLVKNETGANEKYNGVWRLSSVGDLGSPWVLDRRDDCNTAAELEGATIPVLPGGTANANTNWRQVSVAFTLDTDPVVFTAFGGAVPDAAEGIKGKAAIAITATIQNEATTNDTEIVTPKKFWQGITRFLALAWTFAAKITFTTAPRFSSTTASKFLKVDANKDLTSGDIASADLPQGDGTNKGAVKLYAGTGANTDGAMTQAATTNALTDKADLDSPTFIGTPIGPTPATATSNQQLATTAFVHAVVNQTGGAISEIIR